LTGRIDRSIARLIDAYMKLVSIEKLALALSGIGVVSTNVDGRK